jgi:hypothetical protein
VLESCSACTCRNSGCHLGCRLLMAPPCCLEQKDMPCPARLTLYWHDVLTWQRKQQFLVTSNCYVLCTPGTGPVLALAGSDNCLHDQLSSDSARGC